MADAFGERLLATLTGGALTLLISLGDRTGLFEAAAVGPATSAGLAERAGLDERYVREWLGAMVSGGFFAYDATTGEYVLPPEHARLLTGETAANAAPMASTLRGLGAMLTDLEARFGDGLGLAPETFGRRFAAVGVDPGENWRRIYDDQLIDGFLAAVPGLTERLSAGARVLDLGCGTGHAVNLMGTAFTASDFTGLDIDADLIGRAEAERVRLGAGNVSFEVADAATLTVDRPYDVIFAFDAVHDQRDPAEVLRRIRAALAPGGVFVMVDAYFSSRLENNLDNPLAPLCYAISLLYCTPMSRYDDGAGLGAMWGTELAGSLLAEAGFSQVELMASPRAQNCLFVCRT
ncbi:class I SAM-dependent methyltransferase [Kribbella sp. NPDC056861]|uniref:class I SAM-dependent methyltransferase n=1 Tax=Kribbella sp. NPDC056861 TaxID=3154857 RepID=UPI003436DC0A